MTFSERLVQLRKEKNITQRQLASALNLSEVGIQNYEGGRRKPAYDILLALADYFNVSIDYLTGRTDCPDIVTKDKDGNYIAVEAMHPSSDK